MKEAWFMSDIISKCVGAFGATALLLTPVASFANSGAQQVAAAEHDHAHEHSHAHAHDEEHGHSDPIYKGYFKDDQVKARELTDWDGDWQSVYPYLMDGSLESVLEAKAKKGPQTIEEYRDYYKTGYNTDINRIVIDGSKVTYYKNDKPYSGEYASDGHEILTYKKGNRGVRFIFKKISGDADAPQFIQFSDHGIFPAKAEHYHLYMGNDRAELLKEMDHWPTYYRSSLNAKQIADEMLAH